MSNQTLKTSKPAPFIGCENLNIYTVASDTASEYTASEIISVENGLAQVSFNPNESTNDFYADNKKAITEITKSPSAGLTIGGTNYDIEQLLYGKVESGGALIDGEIQDEVGFFYKVSLANGKWMVRQVLKSKATKGEQSVDTKGDNTNFQTVQVNFSVLGCNKFNTYVREFYSDSPVMEGLTAEDVIAALRENVAATFPLSE